MLGGRARREAARSRSRPQERGTSPSPTTATPTSTARPPPLRTRWTRRTPASSVSADRSQLLGRRPAGLRVLVRSPWSRRARAHRRGTSRWTTARARPAPRPPSAGSCSLTFTSAGARTLSVSYAGDAELQRLLRLRHRTRWTRRTQASSDLRRRARAPRSSASPSPCPGPSPWSLLARGRRRGNVTVDDGAGASCSAAARGRQLLPHVRVRRGADPVRLLRRRRELQRLVRLRLAPGGQGGHQHCPSPPIARVPRSSVSPSPCPGPSPWSLLARARRPATSPWTTAPALPARRRSRPAAARSTFGSAGARTLSVSYAGDADFNGSSDSAVASGGQGGHQPLHLRAEPEPLGRRPARLRVLVGLRGRSWLRARRRGSVTVDDGAGASCSAPLAAGSCSVTFDVRRRPDAERLLRRRRRLQRLVRLGLASGGQGGHQPLDLRAEPEPLGRRPARLRVLVRLRRRSRRRLADAAASPWTTAPAPPAPRRSRPAAARSRSAPPALRTLSVSYSGDADFNGSSDSASHQVDKADTSLSISARERRAPRWSASPSR